MHVRSISLLLLSILIAGCQPPPKAPPEDLITQGIAQALIDTGFYSEVAVTRIIGKHYNPSERAWKVFGCFQFVLPTGQQGSTCMDSFQTLQLDSGDWIVSATVEGAYRWRAISTPGIDPARPEPADRPTAGADTSNTPSVIPTAAESPSGESQSGNSTFKMIDSESRSSDQAR